MEGSVGLSDLFAVGLLAAFVVLLIVRTGTELRWPTHLRTLPAFDQLRLAVERAVESGERVHLSLGTGTLIGADSGPALAALSALSQTAELTLGSDRPVVASSGDGAIAAASQEALRGTLGRLGSGDSYHWTNARLLAPTPFSYVAALPEMLASERVSVHILLGHFGNEGALAADMGGRARAFVLAGTDAVPTQAQFFAIADQPLIGEEAFAAGAYLGAGGMQRASLRVQDLLRLVLIVAIVVGTLLQTLGVGL
jgi:hypothetical protein